MGDDPARHYLRRFDRFLVCVNWIRPVGWDHRCSAGSVHLFAPGRQRCGCVVLRARCRSAAFQRLVGDWVVGAELPGAVGWLDRYRYWDHAIDRSNRLELYLASMDRKTIQLALCCAIALIVRSRRIQIVTPSRGLTPADGTGDLWALVRFPVAKVGAFLRGVFVEWAQRFSSDWLFARVPGLNPRLHPWRFAGALGLLVGAGLVLAQLQEGVPPNLRTGLLVAGVFLSAELIATLLGFAILGGYLGLRPSFSKRN
jgi:hypothetical protein